MTGMNKAVSLMREALELLDNAGAATPACHLQAAIDAAEDVEPLRPGETISQELEDRILGPMPNCPVPFQRWVS